MTTIFTYTVTVARQEDGRVVSHEDISVPAGQTVHCGDVVDVLLSRLPALNASRPKRLLTDPEQEAVRAQEAAKVAEQAAPEA